MAAAHIFYPPPQPTQRHIWVTPSGAPGPPPGHPTDSRRATTLATVVHAHVQSQHEAELDALLAILGQRRSAAIIPAIGGRMALDLQWINPVAFRQQLDLAWRVYRVSFRKSLPLEWDCGIPLRTLSLLWTCVPDTMIVPEEETVLRPVSKTTRAP